MHAKINRRKFLGTAAVGSAGIGLGGLGFGSRALAQAAPLTMWVPGGSEVVCQLQRDIAAGFAAAQSAAVVEDVNCIGNASEFGQNFIAAVVAGNPPSLSIVWDTPVALGAQGLLLPLDEFMATSALAGFDAWPAGLLASCQFNGKTFGVPVVAGSYAMYYNAEMLDAKGIPSDRASFPKTWDEMRRLSKEFTVWDGDYLQTAGFLPSMLAETLPIWAGLNGGRIYDAENNKVTLTDERVLELFRYNLEWLEEEYHGDLAAIERSGQFQSPYASAEGQPPAFQLGQLVGVESGSWLMGDFANSIPLTFERWDAAPYPVGPSGSESVSGTWPNWLVIPRGSNDPAAAWSYIEYLTTTGVRPWFANVPEIPGNINAEVDLPFKVVETRGEAFAADVLELFRHQSQVAVPMWNVPIQGFLNDQVSTVVSRVYSKEATPEVALAEAQAACEAELTRLMDSL